MPHIWSFFESGHGKVEHDRAGACVKRALVKEQLKISATDFLMLVALLIDVVQHYHRGDS